jgi:glutamyl-tRNA reductase
MILCFSASHKNTNLPMLESLFIHNEDGFAKELCASESSQECVMLQTCHRVEIYYISKAKNKSEEISHVFKLWSTETGISSDVIAKVVRVYEEKDALQHLLYVAAGLESVVIGEDQILGQVRNAYFKAKSRNTIALILDRVFMKALNTGKKVRTETKIHEGALSISSAAINLAVDEFGELSNVRSMVIGAGEAGALAAQALRDHGVQCLVISDRTYERGINLAEAVSGKAVKFSDMNQTLIDIDLAVGAVSVSKPILAEKDLRNILLRRKANKKIMFVDISQPRCFDEKIGSIPGVRLRDIDDIKKVLSETNHHRQIEAEKTKTIIAQELTLLEKDLSTVIVQPLIAEICHKFEAIRQKELKRALNKLGESDQEKLEVIDRFSKELVERIAQIPIDRLKKAALGSNEEMLYAVQQMFKEDKAA